MVSARVKLARGTWALPGGKLEFWEKLSDCARRELLEETGLIAKKVKFLQLINDMREEDESHCVHLQFLAEDTNGDPKLMEPNKCYGWEWFPLDNLPENIFIGHQKFFPALRDNLTVVDGEDTLLRQS